MDDHIQAALSAHYHDKQNYTNYYTTAALPPAALSTELIWIYLE